MPNITLYDYQTTALEWLLSHPRTILGDEPGVGKSYPAIEAALNVAPDKPKLIVCPKYVIPNWCRYLDQYSITDYAVLSGSPSKKNTLLDEPHSWYLTTYNMLGQTSSKLRQGKETQGKYLQLLRKRWGVVICDEAHRMRGRNSLHTNAAFRLNTAYLWLLTGSPLYRNAQDIWPLLHLVDKPTFPSFWRFVDEYCLTKRTPWGTEVVDVRNPNKFKAMMRHYMLRREMKLVGIDLPDLLTPKVLTCELTPKVKQNYQQLKTTFRMDNPLANEDGEPQFLRAEAMGVANKLRRLTAPDPNKLNLLTELLEDINERVVIYTWYRASAQAIADKIKTNLIVTGSLDGLKRQQQFDLLQANPYGRLVATIESMKEGVNLQHTSKVIFYEQDWVPETNNQAVGRFYRAGQKNPVQVYYIQARKTLDERVYKVSRERGKNIDRALKEEIYGI